MALFQKINHRPGLFIPDVRVVCVLGKKKFYTQPVHGSQEKKDNFVHHPLQVITKIKACLLTIFAEKVVFGVVVVFVTGKVFGINAVDIVVDATLLCKNSWYSLRSSPSSTNFWLLVTSGINVVVNSPLWP